MFKIMLTLHLLALVFTIGPLLHAVTTAVRGFRSGGDAAATASSARMITIYSYASVLTVIFGFALMSSTSPYTGNAVAKFSEPWIWTSALLWLVGVLAALHIISPALQQASVRISDGAPTDALKTKISAGGGLVAAVFVVVIVLMVYQPGG